MRNINSLKNTAQFRKVYEQGRSLANRYLVLYVLPNEGDFRLGISVSKKVGNSVVRHHVTRLVREAYMALKNQIPTGYDFVVVARVAAGSCSYADILEAFRHLLKQHKLI